MAKKKDYTEAGRLHTSQVSKKVLGANYQHNIHHIFHLYMQYFLLFLVLTYILLVHTLNRHGSVLNVELANVKV